MVSDAVKNVCKMASEDNIKFFISYYQNMILFTIVGGFWSLNDQSYHIYEDCFKSQLFINF